MLVYEGAEGQRQAVVTTSPPPDPPPPQHRPSAEVAEELEGVRLLCDALERVKLAQALRDRDAAEAALGRVRAEKQALIADLHAHRAIEDERNRRAGVPPRAAVVVPSGAQGALAALLSDVERAEIRIQALEQREEGPALVAISDAEAWIASWRARLSAGQQQAGRLEEERRSLAAEAAPPPVPERETWRQRLRAAFAQLGLPPPEEDG